MFIYIFNSFLTRTQKFLFNNLIFFIEVLSSFFHDLPTLNFFYGLFIFSDLLNVRSTKI
jgi:hypothetical protein